MRKLIFTLIIMTGALRADGEKAGEFDYYVLALSWTPTWCALEGDARGSEQCDASKDFGWTLHGLWPQFHQGWPSYCNTIERQPSRSMTNGMSDIMGTSGLAWHQWKKHGTCSGLSARDYYALSREAYGKINRPALFRKLKEPVKVPAKVIEEAFLKENPSLKANTLTITCKQGRIQEARVCFSKALDPVPCGRDTIKDCSMTNALFDPAR
jgi:ribonuclease T2